MSVVRRLLVCNVSVNCTPYPKVYTVCSCCVLSGVKTSVTISQTAMNPLMIASFKGHVDIVRLLIEAKARLNMREKKV